MARIAALGDAHLGRAYLPRTDERGLNQREVDFDRSFEAAVDLALAEEPDAIVWLGDIFDHPRPTYRTFRIAQRALARIVAAGMPCVVITGNHDTPRLPGTGSPYSALADVFGHAVHFAHRMAYERFDVAGVAVHAVPQMMTVEATLDALAEADRKRSLDHTNLLLTHPRVPQVEPRYADINEIEVDAGDLKSDLVLLGHYHFHCTVGRGIWYAGSTDTFTFADDPDKPKGIVVLDTDSGECAHVGLTGQRPLITLPTVEALGLSAAEVHAAVLERAAAVPEGAVARLFVDGVDPEAWRLLDINAVRDTAAAALDLKLHPGFVGVVSQAELIEPASMPARWERFLESQDLTTFDRDRLRDLGRDYLVQAVEEAG
jgi:DNA repair exonuclease SbcCD nuclease subunit